MLRLAADLIGYVKSCRVLYTAVIKQYSFQEGGMNEKNQHM